LSTLVAPLTSRRWTGRRQTGGAPVREVGWRLFIGGARARRRTATQRPWYGTQGGTPREPTVRRAPVRSVRHGARTGTRREGEDFEAPSARALPWEGTVPRSARGPDGEAGRSTGAACTQRVTSWRGTTRRRRPDCVTVSLLEHV
jgi:hypothetical protein